MYVFMYELLYVTSSVSRLDRSVASMWEKVWCRKIAPGFLIAFSFVLGPSS